MADLVFETDSPRPQFDVPESQSFIGDTDAVEPSTDQDAPALPRKRGRPKGSKNRTNPTIYHATQRDKKEVVNRLQNMLTGATGIVSAIRPHFQMTDEEANDIAEPLSAYLIRQEGSSAQVREFLDRYDLIAASIAILTYLVRVWSDDQQYRANAKDRQQRTTRQRPASNRTNDDDTIRTPEGWGRPSDGNGEQSEIDADIAGVSTPYIAGV